MSQATGNKMAPPLAAWADLRASTWLPLAWETGWFALHVPSSHFFSIDQDVYKHLSGACEHPEAAAALAALAASLPVAPAPMIKTDISTITLNMAQGCNLRCTYCFAGEGDYGSKGFMSKETAIRAIDMLSRGKERFMVTFFGGEPLLAFDTIKQVVAWCEAQPNIRFDFAITTNGTLLNDERLAWLKAKAFRVTWSYDGKGLHGKQRLMPDKKTGSDALVERKMAAFGERLNELKFFKLRATITKENLHLLEESLLDTLHSKNYQMMLARHASAEPRFAFTDDDIKTYGEIITRVVDRLLADKSYQRLLDIGNLAQTIRSVHEGRTRQFACGAGTSYITVSISGGFYLCHRFNEDASERYGDIDSGLDVNALEDIRRARAGELEPCRSCWMRNWCGGGCFHEHKMATGNKRHIDKNYCRMQDVEMKQALRIYTHILQDAPELLNAKPDKGPARGY